MDKDRLIMDSFRKYKQYLREEDSYSNAPEQPEQSNDDDEMGKEEDFYKKVQESMRNISGGNVIVNSIKRGGDNLKMQCTINDVVISYDHKEGVFMTANSIKMDSDAMTALYKVVAYLMGEFKNDASTYLT